MSYQNQILYKLISNYLNHVIMSADKSDSFGKLQGSIIPAFEVCLKIGSISVSSEDSYSIMAD